MAPQGGQETRLTFVIAWDEEVWDDLSPTEEAAISVSFTSRLLLIPDLPPCCSQQNRSLPPEIRNAIYAYVLTDSGKDLLTYCGMFLQLDDRRRGRHLDLSNHEPEKVSARILRTCRAVHDEASGILYSENTFFALGLHELRQWLQAIGPRNRGFLRRVLVGWDYRATRLPHAHLGTSAHRLEYWESRSYPWFIEISRAISDLLADSKGLEVLHISYLSRTPACVLPPVSFHRWQARSNSILLRYQYVYSRSTAEAFYDGFLPLITRGLENGRTPEQMSRVLLGSHSRIEVPRTQGHWEGAMTQLQELEEAQMHLTLMIDRYREC
ncbi:Catalase [Colletotrichum higginsianum IMI 349063]|uniref:Catalase n=1 Tax=Colletotrichum higginsianum (strain IMI 349063) TaxID=759273 RepID=A0A1B7YDB5_COLHI|nr:Catalase [Colletotrichum higginsianum IMI 349063]OBR09818.1 Catalase [Colletotrichum higginsianum IMI 349063]